MQKHNYDDVSFSRHHSREVLGIGGLVFQILTLNASPRTWHGTGTQGSILFAFYVSARSLKVISKSHIESCDC
jgi:hypothetical protein